MRRRLRWRPRAGHPDVSVGEIAKRVDPPARNVNMALLPIGLATLLSCSDRVLERIPDRAQRLVAADQRSDLASRIPRVKRWLRAGALLYKLRAIPPRQSLLFGQAPGGRGPLKEPLLRVGS